MPFKTPAPSESHPRSGSISESPGPPEKAIRNVKIYIVQAKLDPSGLSELFKLAEQHAERVCSDADEADVIITAIQMRRRLERHVPWDVAVGTVQRVILEASAYLLLRSRKRW